MSINTTNGILDITGAVVRVSKMEFKQATGFDTVFNNIARNTILLSDSDTYETTTTYHNWALKLPNAWVFEADVYLASGTSGGGDHTFQLNFYNNVNTAIANGYTLGLDGTSLTLSYDGTQISTATLSTSLNDDAWHKLFVLFERDTFAVAIDGKPEYTFTDSVLRDRVYNDDTGYVVFYHEAGVARKIKNLKFVNGDKWIRESGSSNIAYIGGSVGIGTDAPKHTLDVLGNANVGTLTVTSVSGDGSGLSLIQSSNVSDFASNVTRIGTLETDLDSNVSRIGTLESGDLTIGGEKTFSSNLEVGTANLFVDTTTGRVGVGTESPGTLLELSKATGSATISPTELRLSTTTNAADWNVTDPWARLSFYTDDVTGDAPGVMASVGAVASSADGGENTRLAFFTAEPHLERMCIDRYGNVGIGTANPATPFNINKLTATLDPKAHTTTEFIRLRGDKIVGQTYAISGGIKLGGDTGGTATADGRIEFYANDGADVGNSYGDVPDNFIMCMRGDGNVGIGTVSPTTKLHVEHYGSAIGDFEGIRIANHATNLHATTRPAYEFVVSDVDAGTGIGNGKFAIGYRGTTSASRTDRLVIDNSGNVGIGTASPQLKMDVYTDDTSGSQLYLRNANTGGRGGLTIAGANGENFNLQKTGVNSSNVVILENYSTTNGGIHFYTKGDGDYRFRTTNSNSTRFLITNDGDVAVGAITPQSKLHVDGDVRMKTLSTNAIGKITPVYARGTGNNNNANRRVKIGDTTHVDGTGRGLTLTIINASTHAHVSSTIYDTYGSTTASNNLATALEAMTDAQIGILTSHDAFEDNMTGNLVTACLKLGLTRLAGANDDNNRHPYCAIFYGPGASGVAGNHAIEVMKSDSSSGAYATLSTFLVDDSFMGQTVTNALYSGTADNTIPTVFVNKNKNVGIGTTIPDAPLDIRSTRNAESWAKGNSIFNVLHNNGSGAYYGMSFGVSANHGDGVIQTYNVQNGNAQYDLRLQPNGGNVGIGMTNPAGSLHIDTSSNGEIMIGAIGSGQATAPVCIRDVGGNQIHFYYSTTQVGRITSTSTSTSYNTSSDYRIKENVIPLVSALERVNDLHVYRFNFITDTEKTVDGFFAHEVQSVVPEAITGVKDETEDIGVITNIEDGKTIKSDVTEPTKLKEGTEWTYTGSRPVYQSIDQSKLVPLLTKAIQELKLKNDALEARIAALENA